MTFRQALDRARDSLARSPNIDNPSLVAEILLRHVLQISRVQLYLDLNHELSLEKEKELQQVIDRQLRGEPVAYITRHREFYGLDFYVDPRVLIPRPESELLVEQALVYIQNNPAALIADIGTGSGAIAISLAVNLFRSSRSSSPPQARIYAIDISPQALEVARLNCQKHDVVEKIKLLQGDLLKPLPEPVDLIIANLPYVQKSVVAEMPSAKYEPNLALDGGESGLDRIFQLCRQLKAKLHARGCLLMEIGMGQSPAVTDYLRQLYPTADIQVLPDLTGIGRVIKMA